MKNRSIIFTVAGLAASLQLVAAADITGTVTLKGTPPPEKDITPLKEDVTCGVFHKEMPKTRFFVVGGNGGLADVVVMVKGISGKSTGAGAAPVVLDQKSCEYTPQILAVQTGQKVVVKNSDPVMHNVHTVPTAAGNNEQNLAQLQGAPNLTMTFDKPENFVKFKCDVHPWMFAWVTVVDHPYFAVTDKDGKFTIKDLPAGKYTVVALHRKAAATGVEKEVDVAAGNATADFTLEVPAAK